MYSYKNARRQRQYNLYIFLGPNIKPSVRKILETIQEYSILETYEKIKKEQAKLLIDTFGIKWHKYFWTSIHINKNKSKLLKLREKIKRNWGSKHASELENKIQSGGNKEPKIEITKGDSQILDELHAMIVDPSSKKIVKQADEKETLIKIKKSNAWDSPKEQSRSDVLTKNYVYNYILSLDEPLISIQQKIALTVDIPKEVFKDFKSRPELTPNYQYLWCYDKYGDISSLSHAWFDNEELWEFTPKNPIKSISYWTSKQNHDVDSIYSKLNHSLNNLEYQNLQNFILKQIFDNPYNEIYVTDIFTELLTEKYLIENWEDEQKKIFHQTVMRRYFPKIPDTNWLGWLDGSVNLPNTYNRIEKIKPRVYIQARSEEWITKMSIPDRIRRGKEYITQINFKWKHKIEWSDHKIRMILDNIVVNEELPLIYYKPPFSHAVSKVHIPTWEQKPTWIMNWISNWKEGKGGGHGLGFKIKFKNYDNLFQITLNNQILEGRMVFKYEKEVILEKILPRLYEKTIEIVRLINKTPVPIKLPIPKHNQFYLSFINAIKPVPSLFNKKVNHNKLSNIARFWFPYLSLNIDPSKSGRNDGTFLRYTRVNNFQTVETKENRIRYFIRNYKLSDKEISEQIQRDFNITSEEAINTIKSVKEKYDDIPRNINTLKTLDKLPRSKQEGVTIEIQGKNTSIKVLGAKDRIQLDRILDIVERLIYQYISIQNGKDKQLLSWISNDLKHLAK